MPRLAHRRPGRLRKRQWENQYCVPPEPIHESQHYAWDHDWWLSKGINYADYWENYRREGEGKEGTDYTQPDYDYDADHIPNRVEYKNTDKNSPWVFTGHDPAVDCTYDWQNAYSPTPGRLEDMGNDEQELNCRVHKDQRGNRSKDWGNPGMNHGTDGKFDD